MGKLDAITTHSTKTGFCMVWRLLNRRGLWALVLLEALHGLLRPHPLHHGAVVLEVLAEQLHLLPELRHLGHTEHWRFGWQPATNQM